MIRRLHILLLLLAAALAVQQASAQAVGVTRRERLPGVFHQGWIVERGDSIPHIDIIPVYVFSRPIDLRRYRQMVEAVKRVYPMAQAAKAKMHEMEDKLLTFKTKKERREYVRQCYKDLLREYTPVAKRMTRTQGRVFIKLLDRETDYTAYELIREFRGGFVATFWQGVGKLFGHNLKTQYDGQNEDRLLEQIVVYYEAGLLP